MNWYQNLNAKPRLAIAFGILLLLTLGIGIFGIYSLDQAAHRVELLYQRDMRGAMAVQDLAIYKNDVARQDRDALMQINNAQVVETDLAALKTDLSRMRDAVKNADGTFYGKEEVAAFAELNEIVPEYEKNVLGIMDSLKQRNADLTRSQLLDGIPIAKKLTAQMDKVRQMKEHDAEQNFESNQQAHQSARVLIVSVVLAALLIGIVLALYIANGFSRPLVATAGVLERVADGDLTVSLDIDTQDEIGRMATALNQAVGRLQKTMREVAASATHASTSSQQLAAASESIAAGAQEQAASLEETSASLEEITATVRNTADNAHQASQLAAASKDSATQGQEVVSAAIKAMSEIEAASAKISDIISAIDEIAFQTNLLAVNAAVEAARAGEEGRGFAVVASEVRSLAQRSASAAKEIKGLIQDSLRKVEAGSALVNKSGETLHGIVGSVKRVTDIVGEIAAAAREQSVGVDQVNSAMTQMDHVTQSNSAQTEELSATAEALAEQAAHLLRLIGTFTLTRESDGFSTSAYQALVRPKVTKSLSKPAAAKFVSTLTKPVTAGISATDASFEDF